MNYYTVMHVYLTCHRRHFRVKRLFADSNLGECGIGLFTAMASSSSGGGPNSLPRGGGGASSSSRGGRNSRGGGASGSATNMANLPVELRAALLAARPVCPHWGTEKGCRKGRRCTLLHGNDLDDPELKLPHVSMNRDGSMSLRPPLMGGLQKWWSQHGTPGRPMPLTHGEAWQLSGGLDVMTYNLPRGSMASPDLSICATVTVPQGCHAKWGKSTDVTYRGTSGPAPRLILHSTSVEAALSILRDGEINHSNGIAGFGIYGFEIHHADDGGDQHAIEQAWLRGATGGYNRGAAFVLQTHGLLCKAKTGDDQGDVPPGVIVQNKDQFAAHRTAVEYHSVVVQKDALLCAIGEEMDQSGYSIALHEALVAIQTHLGRNSSLPRPA